MGKTFFTARLYRSASAMQGAGPVFIALLAVLLGSVLDASVKWAATGLPLITLVWWRFIIAAVLITPPYLVQRRSFGPWPVVRFHLLRGMVHAATVVLFFNGIIMLPLAEATVLGFTAVLMVPFLERVSLKEPIQPVSLVAALVGFLGVVVINGGVSLGEDSALIQGRLFCLGAAFLYAVMLLMLRSRAQQDSTHLIAIYSNIMPALWLLVPMVMTGVLPDGHHIPILVWLALVGSGVWVLMSIAYARASAQTLAPLEYVSLLSAALLGYVFFDEVPSARMGLGALFILGAVALVMMATRKKAIGGETGPSTTGPT